MCTSITNARCDTARAVAIGAAWATVGVIGAAIAWLSTDHSIVFTAASINAGALAGFLHSQTIINKYKE